MPNLPLRDEAHPLPRQFVTSTLSYAIGPIALLAQTRLSTIHAPLWRTGALAMAGLAGSF